MKVVEKNCPNCGSSIEIVENARIFKCKYCGTTLERDKNEELEIKTKETALNIIKYVFTYMGIMEVISAIIFIAVFIIIIIVAIYIFSHM